MVTESTDAPADNIRSQQLVDEMQSSYLDYAMSVIVSRALPDVRDGLKPVQRRILYAMDDLGMRANQPYRKSARIVGEVLGKYHPHADVPVYEAMVRMAQPWNMRAPLIDGQGNYGSVDHDPPAAMRYTEARLSAICEEMLADIDKNTVDFTPNFDESLNEPTVLPGRLPNLLVNGAAGIAVAMACKLPPHNLGEAAAAVKMVIERPDASIGDLMTVLKGPDFPTAGILFAGENDEDLKNAYARGRGGFTLRGRQHVEETAGNRVQIVFTEIPYQANKVRIIEQVAQHVRDKKIDGIRDLRDESDRHGMRLVIELGRDANVRTVLAHLYRSTDLQIRYDTNFVALTGGRPRTFSLIQLITAFIDHRREIITRRTEFDLEKARDRHHIVEGLLKAIDMIDEIIAAIRAAESADAARDRLQDDPFDLSERQAQAVLDMQLRRLAALERTRLEEEYRDLTETIEYLEGLLADPKKIDGVIINDLDELVETYGSERKTQIISRSVEEFSEADLVPHQASVVTLTRHGYIKRQAVDAFRSQRRGGVGVKGVSKRGNGADGAQDAEAPARMIACDTHDQLLLFTDQGRVFCLQAHEVDERSREWRGLPVRNLIDLQPDERVTTVVPVTDFADDYIILGTRRGQVKRMPLSAFANVRRSGLKAFNLREGDELVEAAFAQAGDDVIMVTSEGRAIRFAVTSLRATRRGSGGMRGIVVPDGAELVGLQRLRADLHLLRAGQDVLTVTASGFGKRTPETEYPTKGRAGKGMIGHKINDETQRVVGMSVVRGDEELVVISAAGKILRTEVGQIRQCSRSTKGVKVMNVTEGDVASIAVVDTTREFGQQD